MTITRARARPDVVLLDPACFTPFYDLALASRLARRGWSVTWVTSAWEFESLHAPRAVQRRDLFLRSLHAGTLARLAPLHGSARLRRAVKLLSYPVGLARVARLLAARAPGVLHVQWSHVPALDAALWLRWRRAGWKVVYTAHDPHPLAGTTPRLLRAAYARLRAAADAIVVHGPAARDEIVAEGTPPDRVHVVDPVVPRGPASLPDRVGARRVLGLPAAAPVILFLGFVKPYKGLTVLLESVAVLRATSPDVRLLVAGAVLGSRRAYDDAVARLGLGGHVRWSNGYVPEAELGSYLAAADVVALPYLDASSSGVALLAQHGGRPVVATRVGDLAQLVEDGASGYLVPPGDAAALARSLARVLGDRAQAERMGRCGRDRIAALFSGSRAVARLEALYAALLGVDDARTSLHGLAVLALEAADGRAAPEVSCDP